MNDYMITPDERTRAFLAASPTIASVYTSLETAILLGDIRKKYSIPQGIFTDIVGDTILGLLNPSDFQHHLVSLMRMDPNNAQLVFDALRPLFSPQETSSVMPPISSSGEVANQNGNKILLETRPLTRDELVKALGGSRTMAGDVERAQGTGPNTTSVAPTPTQGNTTTIPQQSAGTPPTLTPRQSILPSSPSPKEG